MIETGGGLLGVFALILANGFFVAAEFALVTIRRTRVAQLIREGRPGAGNVEDAIRHLDSYIAASQLGITISSLALGWIGEPALAGLLERAFGEGAHAVAITITFVVITALHVIAGELAPKGIALQYPERTALVVAGPLRLFRAVFRPAIWLLNESGWAVARLLGVSRDIESGSPVEAEELRLVVQASAEAGALREEDRFLLQRVLRFGDLTVEAVMTPRTEVHAIPVDATVGEAQALVEEARHSRYPVYRGDLDNVVGVLHVRDLLGVAAEEGIEPLMREAMMVPAQANVQELLREMRQRRTQFAIAVDEYGGSDGIVTLENVLEEIVGELQDEFEEPGRATERRPGGVIRIDAGENVEVLTELLGIEVEPGQYNTVAGLILERTGSIPSVGDRVTVGPYTLAVVEMDQQRIAAVEARPVEGAAGAAARAARPEPADQPPHDAAR